MASWTRLRTTSSWLAAVLTATLVPLLGPAAPAHADHGCTTEVPVFLPPSACDDDTPPDTTLSAMQPAPNAAGWTRAASVTFTFAAVNTDPADTDEMRMECKLEGPSQAHDWRACDSSTQEQYTDLADTTGSASYTFSVRAFDNNDRNIDYDDPSTPLANEDEVADEDATPESRSWKQDTEPPVTFIFEGPYDSEGTGWPIVTKPQVTYRLDSNEDGVTYRCQLDGTTKPCDEGPVTFKGLSGGNRTLSVTATDQAGNTDPSAESEQFVVPYNLTKGRNWTKKRARGYFAGDVLQTRKAGARIKFRAQNIREFRVVAPAGPKLGKIRVRTGTGFWKTYDLSKGKATKSRYIVVRDAASPLFSGQILVESLSRGKQVRVDALVFPPS